MLRKANLATSALSLIVVSINFLLFLVQLEGRAVTPLQSAAIIMIPSSIGLLFMSALFGWLLLEEVKEKEEQTAAEPASR